MAKFFLHVRKALLLAILSLSLAACQNATQPGMKSTSADAAFDAYKARFVEDLWKQYPVWASSQGYHRYDSILSIPDARFRETEIAFSRQHLDSLKTFEVAKLSENNRTDYLMIRDQLEGNVWSVTTLRSYEWNPSSFNVSETIAEMIGRDYAQLDVRLRAASQRMAAIPLYYEAAKQNLTTATPEHTLLAIEQNRGGASVFTTDLKDALLKSGLSKEEKDTATARAVRAVAAINGYADFLEENIQPKATRNFRLGSALYEKKFDYDIQSRYRVDEVYKKAVARKEELHRKMFDRATRLWPKYMSGEAMPGDTLARIRAIIDKLSLQHAAPDSFQAAIEAQIPVLTAFVQEKNLLYLDPSKPLVVRKEPAYMAGVAGASISSPGPYDKGGDTYYNVGSLAGWEPARAESYLREYNKYTMQILNIHEAIPGHYAQLVYSNQSPSIIKSIFGNGAMVEGWAVYTELMMLENGYGNNSDELWMMYYKWNLRSVCNTILDIDVHTRNMSKEAALDLLIKQAFQQQAEAEGKWRRVTLSQVQLTSYFTGFTEILDLREELKAKQGKDFDLKAFHEKFLSYGSAPVKYIREMMLGKE